MSRRVARFALVRPGVGVLLWLALAVAGCGPQTVTVSGTVTFRDRALSSGTVLFHGAGGRVEHAVIGPDGRYAIADAPPGAVRITVKSHPAAPAGLPSSGGKPPPAPAEFTGLAKERRDGKYVAIPPRYQDPDRSGLGYTVRPGRQTHDIELLP